MTQNAKKNEWAENLPIDCPPKAAINPKYERFYRLVKQFPPTEEDFSSQRKLYPEKRFNTNECRARSLSIFSCFEECVKLLKLPLHRPKKIVQLKLPPKSGVILQTGNNPTHYSWWKKAKYNPIPDCLEVKPCDE
ncbi:hypothetical protein PN36_02300 [Candidatus Thiomargarita nelsonii]|uniref:Uncharacterized protein n=1 Tax=Candidatus Thiomargarita nelsonii TaxID=1003181 RepID=A0A4E0R7G0_9GAMM|nr:hypothetical protein PN36_02300 [Candidatus Thiomargarita nelsonii]